MQVYGTRGSTVYGCVVPVLWGPWTSFRGCREWARIPALTAPSSPSPTAAAAVLKVRCRALRQLCPHHLSASCVQPARPQCQLCAAWTASVSSVCRLRHLIASCVQHALPQWQLCAACANCVHHGSLQSQLCAACAASVPAVCSLRYLSASCVVLVSLFSLWGFPRCELFSLWIFLPRLDKSIAASYLTRRVWCPDSQLTSESTGPHNLGIRDRLLPAVRSCNGHSRRCSFVPMRYCVLGAAEAAAPTGNLSRAPSVPGSIL